MESAKKVYTYFFAFLSRVRSGNLAIAVKAKLKYGLSECSIKARESSGESAI